MQGLMPHRKPGFERVFNTPLECGLRLLFLLDAVSPLEVDLQRLLSYDYLLVHSGDVDRKAESLHPAVPFRGTEWLVKRDLISRGLDLMYAKELLEKRLSRKGITYAASALTGSFIELLKSEYAMNVRARSRWVADRFGTMGDQELSVCPKSS